MKYKDVIIWISTLLGFLLSVVLAIHQLYKEYSNNPQVSEIVSSLGRSFSNGGVIYSYIVWLVFLTFYGVLRYYELVRGTHPKRTKDNLIERNYFYTLWVWGTAAMLVQHICILTNTRWLIANQYSWILVVLGIAIGLLGMGMLLNGRVHIDGYWTNHIYTYPNHKVVDTGLYSRVRHPIYGGQIYIAISIFLVFNNWWILFFPLLTLLYNVLRARREERALSALNIGYDAYKMKCPNFMFFPLEL